MALVEDVRVAVPQDELATLLVKAAGNYDLDFSDELLLPDRRVDM